MQGGNPSNTAGHHISQKTTCVIFLKNCDTTLPGYVTRHEYVWRVRTGTR